MQQVMYASVSVTASLSVDLLCTGIKIQAAMISNSRRVILYLCLSLIILNTVTVTTADQGDCKIIKEKNPEMNKREKELLNRLGPLKGSIFSTSDNTESKRSGYFYKLGICSNVSDVPFSGVMQFNSTFPNQRWLIGRYNATKIMGGTDWIFLTYDNGEEYKSDCNKTKRTANIMIVCDPFNLKGTFKMLEERKKDETDYCYYLFELGSNVACTVPPVNKHLSSGSVFCIIFFTLTGIYLTVGFLYKRLIVGARGLEQIPHYSFWRDFGNLQADGCDLICRCGPRQEEHAYRGIENQIPKYEEEDRDDQLLTM
ncbi:cation-dependent mannose-6-phosphate receptor-like [Limulus polyphemus]|uniref:Cation-dependent mannose-6-phosphate receptor-like n=1 Tax=Limulus polyphemus TaxID=6850 RepID=A0ABM1B3M9_LIMPO|nr:cation-dependent mannose-6-phosphate receptor-like [Limulus polyphemus]